MPPSLIFKSLKDKINVLESKYILLSFETKILRTKVCVRTHPQAGVEMRNVSINFTLGILGHREMKAKTSRPLRNPIWLEPTFFFSLGCVIE